MLRWRAADELMVSILPDQHPPVLNAANMGQVGFSEASSFFFKHKKEWLYDFSPREARPARLGLHSSCIAAGADAPLRECSEANLGQGSEAWV